MEDRVREILRDLPSRGLVTDIFSPRKRHNICFFRVAGTDKVEKVNNLWLIWREWHKTQGRPRGTQRVQQTVTRAADSGTLWCKPHELQSKRDKYKALASGYKAVIGLREEDKPLLEYCTNAGALWHGDYKIATVDRASPSSLVWNVDEVRKAFGDDVSVEDLRKAEEDARQ